MPTRFGTNGGPGADGGNATSVGDTAEVQAAIGGNGGRRSSDTIRGTKGGRGDAANGSGPAAAFGGKGGENLGDPNQPDIPGDEPPGFGGPGGSADARTTEEVSTAFSVGGGGGNGLSVGGRGAAAESKAICGLAFALGGAGGKADVVWNMDVLPGPPGLPPVPVPNPRTPRSTGGRGNDGTARARGMAIAIGGMGGAGMFGGIAGNAIAENIEPACAGMAPRAYAFGGDGGWAGAHRGGIGGTASSNSPTGSSTAWGGAGGLGGAAGGNGGNADARGKDAAHAQGGEGAPGGASPHTASGQRKEGGTGGNASATSGTGDATAAGGDGGDGPEGGGKGGDAEAKSEHGAQEERPGSPGKQVSMADGRSMNILPGGRSGASSGSAFAFGGNGGSNMLNGMELSQVSGGGAYAESGDGGDGGAGEGFRAERVGKGDIIIAGDGGTGGSSGAAVALAGLGAPDPQHTSSANTGNGGRGGDGGFIAVLSAGSGSLLISGNGGNGGNSGHAWAAPQLVMEGVDLVAARPDATTGRPGRGGGAGSVAVGVLKSRAEIRVGKNGEPGNSGNGEVPSPLPSESRQCQVCVGIAGKNAVIDVSVVDCASISVLFARSGSMIKCRSTSSLEVLASEAGAVIETEDGRRRPSNKIRGKPQAMRSALERLAELLGIDRRAMAKILGDELTDAQRKRLELVGADL